MTNIYIPPNKDAQLYCREAPIYSEKYQVKSKMFCLCEKAEWGSSRKELVEDQLTDPDKLNLNRK